MRGARSGYWSNVECEITAMQNLRVVEILDFEVKASTDGGCHEDVLIHGRDDFCGTVGPINVTMAAGDSMHWVALADYDGGGLDGWTLCATPADITEPTTPTEPTGPTEPTEPTTPTEPVKPVKPSAPLWKVHAVPFYDACVVSSSGDCVTNRKTG